MRIVLSLQSSNVEKLNLIFPMCKFISVQYIRWLVMHICGRFFVFSQQGSKERNKICVAVVRGLSKLYFISIIMKMFLLFLQKRRRDLISLGVCQFALETQTLTAINHQWIIYNINVFLVLDKCCVFFFFFHRGVRDGVKG